MFAFFFVTLFVHTKQSKINLSLFAFFFVTLYTQECKTRILDNKDNLALKQAKNLSINKISYIFAENEENNMCIQLKIIDAIKSMKGVFLPLTPNDDINKSLRDINNIRYYSSKEDKKNRREDVAALYNDFNKSLSWVVNISATKRS